MSRPPVIDACSLVFDRESWRGYFLGLAEVGPNYLRAFSRNIAGAFGMDREAYLARLAIGDIAGAVDLIVREVDECIDVEAHLSRRDAEGVVAEILLGSTDRMLDGDNINSRVAAMAAKAPDRLRAWAGVHMLDPDEALDEVERCRGLGMRGLAITTFWDGADVTDPACDRVFARAEELGWPVWLHTGHHFCASRPARTSHPENLDVIAGRHPGLVIVAGHGGWPWVLETISVAQRHRNVYLEFSTHRPSWMSQPGSGWEPLLLYGRHTLRRKVLFGTAGWANSTPIAALADEVVALGLGHDVTHDWLYANAARAFGIAAP